MNIKTLFAFLVAVGVSCATVYAAPGGGQPGGDQPGGGQPGGDQPGGASGSLTYDDFISVTTNAYCLVRDGTLYGYTESLTTSVAPTSADVTALAHGVFAGNTSITTVNLASTSITEVPSDCFAGCTALASVTLPASCKTIGANAFAGCTNLSSVTASGEIDAVGHDAFRDCTSLAEIQFTAAALGPYSFANTALAGVNLSGAAAEVGAFSGCSSLSVALNIPADVPDALFAGDIALATADISCCTSIGAAAFAGCDELTTLTLDPSATLGAYALAADEATVATTLVQSALPTYADTSFLGREVSYTPDANSVTRIEASDLVDWLSDAVASASVTKPADYNTATLKTWLADAANAYAYAYADDVAADQDFLPLTVSGSSFIYNGPSDAAISISVEPVACYTLSADESDWTADNLTWSEDDGAYLATDTSVASCFARLRFTWDW
jgi:hypothetical protein